MEMTVATAYYKPASDTVNAGRLLRKACATKDVQLKYAALVCQIDFATFSRGIHGLGPLDINRLMALPEKVLRRWFKLVLQAKTAVEWEADSERKEA